MGELLHTPGSTLTLGPVYHPPQISRSISSYDESRVAAAKSGIMLKFLEIQLTLRL